MSESTLAPEVLAYYERGGEADRLTASPQGRVEFLRTQDVLRRLIGDEPVSVLDVGGGMGIHAEWLAADGHRVTLVDPVASHVDAAGQLAGVEAYVGDARALDVPDASFEVVLLLGPLYHLQSTTERIAALAEATRVVRAGGLVAAATINRFAAWHDGVRRGQLSVEGTVGLYDQVAATGELRGRDHGYEDVFTTAYLHRPEQVLAEFDAAGMPGAVQYSVEGAVWLVAQLGDILDDEAARVRLMTGLRETEREPTLLGVSSHLLTAYRAVSSS